MDCTHGIGVRLNKQAIKNRRENRVVAILRSGNVLRCGKCLNSNQCRWSRDVLLSMDLLEYFQLSIFDLLNTAGGCGLFQREFVFVDSNVSA